MKSVLIGSVLSSNFVLEEMIACNFPVNLVLGLDEAYSEDVSGYYPIHETAAKHGIAHQTFQRINAPEIIARIREIEPDYIFVMGLSQLIKQELIDCAKIGTVGLHPTRLPQFRGRAVMVWQQLLGVKESAMTMFFIDEGTDSGDILGQEPYEILDTDYAMDLENRSNEALRRLSRRVLTGLMAGTIVPQKQNEEEATYLLIRRPEDGQIDWKEPVEKVHLLIRAVSHPYPGAFGMYDGAHQVIFWRAEIVRSSKYIGIPGQIAEIGEDYLLIVGSGGMIKVTDWENVDGVKLFVGHKFK